MIADSAQTPLAPLAIDRPLLTNLTWEWRGYQINYWHQGTVGAAVLLIHGFGAGVGHWRKNIPALSASCRCYAIDLIGFGASAKPTPGSEINYTFETWSALVRDFCREVICREVDDSSVLLIANSIGCVVAMQAAVDEPELVGGLALLNCSLRLLHERKQATQPWYKQIGAPILQQVLQNKSIGYFFFNQLAKPATVKKILLQAYGRPESVTDELVDILMKPAADAGAADVFLAFTAYSQGPLPEDLLPHLSCPTTFLWGEADPWEPIELGREFAKYPAVQEFIALPEVGHCPQDDAPDLVNPILLSWIEKMTAEDRSFKSQPE
jgi:pimeloyl-ACP methyl ester carboxylesterase